MTESQSDIPTILVVEDEPYVRELAVAVLEELGMRVIEADTADNAISQLEGVDNLAAIFTDVQMPGSKDGVDLAHEIRLRFPDAGILLTSGRSTLAGRGLPQRAQFLSKPWDVEQLLTAMRGVMTN